MHLWSCSRAKAAMVHARSVLAGLQTGGTRSTSDHLAFETIVAALFPDDAKEAGMICVSNCRFASWSCRSSGNRVCTSRGWRCRRR